MNHKLPPEYISNYESAAKNNSKLIENSKNIIDLLNVHLKPFYGDKFNLNLDPLMVNVESAQKSDFLSNYPILSNKESVLGNEMVLPEEEKEKARLKIENYEDEISDFFNDPETKSVDDFSLCEEDFSSLLMRNPRPITSKNLNINFTKNSKKEQMTLNSYPKQIQRITNFKKNLLKRIGNENEELNKKYEHVINAMNSSGFREYINGNIYNTLTRRVDNQIQKRIMNTIKQKYFHFNKNNYNFKSNSEILNEKRIRFENKYSGNETKIENLTSYQNKSTKTPDFNFNEYNEIHANDLKKITSFEYNFKKNSRMRKAMSKSNNIQSIIVELTNQGKKYYSSSGSFFPKRFERNPRFALCFRNFLDNFEQNNSIILDNSINANYKRNLLDLSKAQQSFVNEFVRMPKEITFIRKPDFKNKSTSLNLFHNAILKKEKSTEKQFASSQFGNNIIKSVLPINNYNIYNESKHKINRLQRIPIIKKHTKSISNQQKPTEIEFNDLSTISENTGKIYLKQKMHYYLKPNKSRCKEIKKMEASQSPNEYKIQIIESKDGSQRIVTRSSKNNMILNPIKKIRSDNKYISSSSVMFSKMNFSKQDNSNSKKDNLKNTGRVSTVQSIKRQRFFLVKNNKKVLIN